MTEDLTSEVFVRAVAALPGFEDRGVPILAWLHRIAHARVIDHWRETTRVRLISFESMADRMREANQLEDQVMDQQELDQVRSLMDTLTEEQQRVLALRFLEGRSLEQTAVSMGKSCTAIKAMQRRALRGLVCELEHGELARHQVRLRDGRTW